MSDELTNEMIDDLYHRRLLKLAITINWSHLRDLMKDYLAECNDADEEKTLKQITLSQFLLWLYERQRQQTKEAHSAEKT